MSHLRVTTDARLSYVKARYCLWMKRSQVCTWVIGLHQRNFWYSTDIITCAKGLTSGYSPMGATIKSIGIKNQDGSQPFTNGYTYSYHPVA